MFFEIQRTAIQLIFALILITFLSPTLFPTFQILINNNNCRLKFVFVIAGSLIAQTNSAVLPNVIANFEPTTLLTQNEDSKTSINNFSANNNEATNLCPIKCRCNRTTIDCSNKNLTSIPFNLWKNVEILKLRNNRINNLNLSTFNDLNQLTILDLTDNQLENLPLRLFRSIPNLKILELRKNLLTKIPTAIESLHQLRRLDLRLNRISNITEEDVLRLLSSGAEHIDLARNFINEWPIVKFSNGNLAYSNVVPTNNLKKLDLSGNGLISIQPNNFAIFRHLHVLKLNGNNIKSFAKDSFYGLQQLRILDLSNNWLHSIGALSLHSALHLENLNLAENELINIEAGAFHGVEQLRILNLSSNCLHPNGLMDGGLYGLTHLTHLDLSLNEFSWIDLSMWSYVPSLKWLSLAHNRLQQLPANGFARVNQLHYLSLASNRLFQIYRNAFTGLTNLEDLNLSHNELAVYVEDGSILNNASLPNLKRLNFAANRLRTIPPLAFHSFHKTLKTLDLLDNPVVTISEHAFNNMALKSLKIGTTALFCDCNLQPFLKWVNEFVELNSDLKDYDNKDSELRLICKHPQLLEGHNARKLNMTKVVCSDQNSQITVKIIDEPPAVLNVLIGSDAVLNCSAIGAANFLKLQWKSFEKNGISTILTQKMDTIITERFKTRSASNENVIEEIFGQLWLKNVGVDDEADYQCVASNDFNSDYSRKMTLCVQKVPEIIRAPMNFTALRGQNVIFTCSATGIPTPVIAWKKDDHANFPAAVERRLHIRDNDDVLYLLNVSSVDSGKYTCQASNTIGVIEASAYLKVFDNAFKTQLSNYLYNPLTQTTTLEASIGRTITLDCSTTLQEDSLKTIFIQWYHNGSIIPTANLEDNDNELRIFTKLSMQLLVIQEIEDSDMGLYTCELFINSQFLSRQNFKLNIFLTPETPFNVNNNGYNRNKKYQDYVKDSQPEYHMKISILFIFAIVSMLSLTAMSLSLAFAYKCKDWQTNSKNTQKKLAVSNGTRKPSYSVNNNSGKPMKAKLIQKDANALEITIKRSPIIRSKTFDINNNNGDDNDNKKQQISKNRNCKSKHKQAMLAQQLSRPLLIRSNNDRECS